MNRRFGKRPMLAGLLALTAGTAAVAGAALASAGPALQAMHSHDAIDDGAAMDAHFDKMLAEVLPDATADQKARLKVIARSVHGDLRSVHAQFGPAHQRAHAMLLQSTVDRAGLEALRAEQVQQVDAASRRIVKGLADAAEVLTPDQRVRLAAHFNAHDSKGAGR